MTYTLHMHMDTKLFFNSAFIEENNEHEVAIGTTNISITDSDCFLYTLAPDRLNALVAFTKYMNQLMLDGKLTIVGGRCVSKMSVWMVDQLAAYEDKEVEYIEEFTKFNFVIQHVRVICEDKKGEELKNFIPPLDRYMLLRDIMRTPIIEIKLTRNDMTTTDDIIQVVDDTQRIYRSSTVEEYNYGIIYGKIGHMLQMAFDFMEKEWKVSRDIMIRRSLSGDNIPFAESTTYACMKACRECGYAKDSTSGDLPIVKTSFDIPEYDIRVECTVDWKTPHTIIRKRKEV